MGRRRRSADVAGVDARVRLGPLELPNPIVAASGTFGHGDELARQCDPSRLGAVTTKSLAPYEWPGNPAPRLHMTTAGMLNAVGLQGPGVEHWVDHDLPALAGTRRTASSHPCGGAPSRSSGGRPSSSTSGRDELVAVEVNVSCPNLEDRATMFAHSASATGAATTAVVEADLELPVFVKLSPNVTDLREIAAAALAAGATGLTLVNTLLGLVVDAEARRPALGAGGGGLSGPAIKPVALRAVHDVARAHPDVPIIGTGGVATGVDAVEMLLTGASAVGVGTATFHDPRASLRVLDDMLGWCATHGVTRVADLTGALEDPHVSDVRDRLALALDVGDAETAAAVALVRLAPWFGIAKVGLELYAEAAPAVIERHACARVRGLRRPQALRHPQHGRARRARASAGVVSSSSTSRPPAASQCSRPASPVSPTVHATGGHPAPTALAVTVLTSDADVSAFDARLVRRRDRGLRRRRLLRARDRRR